MTRLNRLQPLIKKAQLALIRAQLHFRGDAEIQSAAVDAKKAFEALSKSERAKFNALMRNFKLIGDMDKAAEKTGVNGNFSANY